MEYLKLNFEDFKRVFEFGTKYYLEPTKNTTGRTTSEPRGLGAILDAFTLGKLTEIGVEKFFYENNKNKKYLLDFDIKKNIQVQDDPDIIKIYENEIIREPNIFVEIKNTSSNDRWIGLTEEQFNTIKRSSKGKSIYFVYASISVEKKHDNYKTTDLTGMFLKEIENIQKSKIFQNFAELNAKCKIEFILSNQDLDKYSYYFEKGMNMYETNLFQEKNKNSIYSKNGLRVDVQGLKEYKNFNGILELKINNYVQNEKLELSQFQMKGDFNLVFKKNSTIIEPLSNVFLENEIFGRFELVKNKFYDFNLKTLGRDPKLKRNNVFISKRKIYQLIEDNKIENPKK